MARDRPSLIFSSTHAEHSPQAREASTETRHERSSLLWTGSAADAQAQQGRTIKAAFYGVQVFYSFFIMYVCYPPCGSFEIADVWVERLLFMTYNGWIMLAVGAGAFLGYLLFGGGSVEKSAACH